MNAKSVRTVSATVALMLMAGALAVAAPTVAEDRLFDPSAIRWIRNGGPVGGMGYDVRIQPVDHNILFATDVWSGVHKSMDGGKTWVQKNAGISTRTGPSGNAIPIFCLTICAQKPDLMWAGCQGFGALYKSMDSGEHWAAKSSGIPDLPGITFRSFTFDPTNPDIVYAGAEVPNVEFKGTAAKSNESTGRIFKTVDGGEHWQQIHSCLALVRWILIDPRNTQVLYAATGIFDRGSVQNEGVFKSIDGGKTWNHANTGLDNLNVGGLDMDPSNPDILYASTGRNDGFGVHEDRRGGVFKTEDGGLLWKRVFPTDDAQRDVVDIVNVAPSDPRVVYAASGAGNFLRSTNAGVTWTTTRAHPDGEASGIPISMAIDPHDPLHVFVNYYNGGINETHDAGRTMAVANTGYTGAQSIGLSAGSLPYVIYSAERSGIHVSTDYGRTWQGLQNGVMTWQGELCDISVNPQEPLHAVASARICCELYRTTDGGATWSRSMKGPDSYPGFEDLDSLNWHGVRVFARSRDDPSTIYAGFQAPPDAFLGQESLGVFKSEDDGATWTSVNSGLSGTTLNVAGIAVNPADAGIVYVCFRKGGVYRSDNGGASWLPIAPTLWTIPLNCIAVDPGNPARLYVGTEGRGVYRSNDSGATWTSLLYGMDQEALIRSIVIHPKDPRIVFAGDWRTGVYCSFDSGSHWQAMSLGLTTRSVNRLALSSDGKVLYAATEGEGVFTTFLSSDVPRICLGGAVVYGRIGLSWSVLDGNVGDYRYAVYRSTNPALFPFERVAENVSGPTYVDTTVTCGTQYFYKVEGVSALGSGSAVGSYAIVLTPTYAAYVDGKATAGEWPGVAAWLDARGDQADSSQIDIRSVYAFREAGWLYLRVDFWNYEDRGWVHINVDTDEDGSADFCGAFDAVTQGGGSTGWTDLRAEPSTTVTRTDCSYRKSDVFEIMFPAYWIQSSQSLRAQVLWVDQVDSSHTGIDDTNWFHVRPVSETPWSLVLASPPRSVEPASVAGGIAVRWQAATPGSYPVKEYNVCRTASAEGSNATLLATVPAAKTSYLDTAAAPGVSWYYVVRAIDSDGNLGAVSEPIAGTFVVTPSEIVLQMKVGSPYLGQGDSLVLMDTEPIIIAGRTLLPVRWIVEALGGVVSWDEVSRQVHAVLGGKTVDLWVGKNMAQVDGVATAIDPSNSTVMPIILKARTMVPVRFVAESLGCTVEWNADTKTVTIRYTKEG